MDFWGIDRTHTSLRLRLAKRLFNVAAPDDVGRLVGSLPTIVAGRPLVPKEAENLLAFVSGSRSGSPELLESVKPNLAAIFFSTLDLWVDDGALHSPSLEGCSFRSSKCLARAISKDLAFYYAKNADFAVFTRYFALFDEKWAGHLSLSAPQFRALYGGLLGCLEGIVEAGVAQAVEQAAFVRLTALCNSDFVVAVQNHLASLEDSFGLSVTAFFRDVAGVCALYAPLSGAELPNLVSFSETQLTYLEGSFDFLLDADNVPAEVIEVAIEAHLRVLEFATSQSEAFLDVTLARVRRLLTDNDLGGETLSLTLSRLAARLVGNCYELLVDVFQLFTEYLSHLEPKLAYRCAHTFTDVCKENFTDETTRITLLYSLNNKLTTEEYSVYATNFGEGGALQWVSALLSAVVAMVDSFESQDLGGLAVTMLDQKRGYVSAKVDAEIIETWGLLIPYLDDVKSREVWELIKNVDRPKKPAITEAVRRARVLIASKCADPELFLVHLLDIGIQHDNPSDTTALQSTFRPLAALVTRIGPATADLTTTRFHDFWLNLAALGFTSDSLESGDKSDLQLIAKWAPPLVSNDSANHVESEAELNPVLRRDVKSNVLTIQENVLSKVITHRANHSSSPLRTIFMAAALLLEELRVQSGNISKLPHYFADSNIGRGPGYNGMFELTEYLTNQYVSKYSFNAEGRLVAIAHNLKALLALSCNRVEPVRRIAAEMITRIVSDIPAALCQHSALFTLLDCITLLDESVRNAVEDEFSPRPVFKAPLSGVALKLSDNLEVREQSLHSFESLARRWVAKITTILYPDLRSKLYTYLATVKSGGKGSKLALDILAASGSDDDFFSQYLLLSRYDSQGVGEAASTTVAKLRSASTPKELQEAYVSAAYHINYDAANAIWLAAECVRAPFRIFTTDAMVSGITFWHHTIRHQDRLRSIVINEVVEQCMLTVSAGKGLFNRDLDADAPLWTEMEYAPTSKAKLDRHKTLVLVHLAPHAKLLSGFLRSCMHNSVLLDPLYMAMFSRLSLSWLKGLAEKASFHSLARNLRLEILEFAIEHLRFLRATQKTSRTSRKLVQLLEKRIIRAGLSWYLQPAPQWPYGSDVKLQAKTLRLLKSLSANVSRSAMPEASLLATLAGQEFDKLAAWHDPFSAVPTAATAGINSKQLQVAWSYNPHLAVMIGKRWRMDGQQTASMLDQLIHKNILAVVGCAEALQLYIGGDGHRTTEKLSSKIIFWSQVSPVEAINLLSPEYGRSKALIQFALRALELHPITKCFFYVPQIVQQLRHDGSGMVAEYILEAAKFSQKFAHQIIWNIMANMYRDDDGTVPDPMKPRLDKVLTELKGQFTEDERKYYETEFSFFAEVTGISGKLKPYIKRSKAEKKEKIDEEMAKIQLPDDVYLPSHPDGTVIDIDRTGGRPLQSHAKAPFLARFKIRVDVDEVNEDNPLEVEKRTEELWQGAIFKVGDDCRQDVLALQLISVFRSIYNFCGLDVYVFPYKVTATAAGRGVIDVLPNSISRDMLGREAVNGLDQWFRSKHGGPNSIEFQRARLNFVKSMAAYSVITWLIQFKDRHNGNIMYDDDGHVIHIDFGFCFDITPGGMGFEQSPFKLTKEMVRVMGGSQNALPYRWFEKLCVQAFLASRVYVDDICRIVVPMLESGLPCFKNNTIKKLRERFALNKTDAEAAQYMRQLISKSYESNFTKGYDEFQRITNGIPY